MTYCNLNDSILTNITAKDVGYQDQEENCRSILKQAHLFLVPLKKPSDLLQNPCDTSKHFDVNRLHFILKSVRFHQKA